MSERDVAVVLTYDKSQRQGWSRWLLRVSNFFRRKGTILHCIEHLIFSEHWEYPHVSTWKLIGQPEHNRPFKCFRRCRGSK